MGLAEEFFWELDNSWKDYKDVGFRTRVVRTMLPREGYEFGSWEEELLDALKESYDRPGYASTNMFWQQVLEGQQNGSFMAVSTLAMIFGNGRVAEDEHFAKTYEKMQKEIEEFFRSGFAEMEARKKSLKKGEDDKPISLIKLKDYSGLKTYLKNHRKNPEAYPLNKRGHKRYNILHLAAKMMDERALKTIFDFSECDVLKSSLSDENLSPLAVFVLKSEGKRRDLFNRMIRSGCNLLQCDTSIHDCPLMIIIERISQGKALYLNFLEDGLAFLKAQGKVQQALFEPIKSSNRSSTIEDYSDDASSSLQNITNTNEEGDEEEHSEVEAEGQDDTNGQSEDESHHPELFDPESYDSEGYESGDIGLPRFEELFERLRGTGQNSRSKQTLFDFMVRRYIVDAIFISLKYSSIPEDAKNSVIPKFAVNSVYSGVSSASARILLDLLLKHGANIDGVDQRGRTALIKSVQHEDVDMTKLLTSRGAKISIADEDGNTAFSIANEYENKEILDILRRERLFARLASSGSRSHRSPRKTSPFDDECHHSKCVICYDRPAEVIFAPCGHRVVCRRDCKKIFELPEEKRCCPLDKEKIESFVVKVYQ
ncbi:hypothetical protein M9434_001962 [Picochlorum sp. BPE23]|nr:hypothetical protein M9434_001962 [Picochlorum sp. BPE23]